MIEVLLKMQPAQRWTLLIVFVASIGGIKSAGWIILHMDIPKILEMVTSLLCFVAIPLILSLYAAPSIQERIEHLFFYKKN